MNYNDNDPYLKEIEKKKSAANSKQVPGPIPTSIPNILTI
jgi:hypothetical protein